MEPTVENSAVVDRVAEAHELVERLKAEIYAGEENNDEKGGAQVALLLSRHTHDRVDHRHVLYELADG